MDCDHPLWGNVMSKVMDSMLIFIITTITKNNNNVLDPNSMQMHYDEA